MQKEEFLSIEKVAKSLGKSKGYIYVWFSQDRTRRRPFFPAPLKMAVRSEDGSRRLVLQWRKKDIDKFIAESKEKPYYLLPEASYEKYKAEKREKEALPTSAFNDFHKLMYQLKQRREVANA